MDSGSNDAELESLTNPTAAAVVEGWDSEKEIKTERSKAATRTTFWWVTLLLVCGAGLAKSICRESKRRATIIDWLEEHNSTGNIVEDEHYNKDLLAPAMKSVAKRETNQQQNYWYYDRSNVTTIDTDDGPVPSSLKSKYNADDFSLDLSCGWFNERNEFHSIPTEIFEMTQLKYLIMWENYITEIPTEIGLLTNLEGIELFSNDIRVLPTEIGKLTNLRSLALHGNEIETIPTEIGFLTNLFHIELNTNKIMSIPSEIGLLKNLEEFILSDNEIISIPTEIGSPGMNMRDLDFSSNLIESIPTEVGSLTNLKWIDFRYNPIRHNLEFLQEMCRTDKILGLECGFPKHASGNTPNNASFVLLTIFLVSATFGLLM